ncbi:MAG: hypothetical protein FWC95_05890, partial [Defluviitaleaceae bacterium]|nr:hypothetical protein [Defluviitaleaceae bacterium]
MKKSTRTKQAFPFIRDVLLVFLAASKILSWIHNIGEMVVTGSDNDIGLGWMVLGRVLNLDLPNLVVAIIFVYMYRRKGSAVARFSILYISALGFTFLYNWFWVMLAGAEATAGMYIAMLIGFSINFAIITTFLLIKDY